jgi:hypothetical protein
MYKTFPLTKLSIAFSVSVVGLVDSTIVSDGFSAIAYGSASQSSSFNSSRLGWGRAKLSSAISSTGSFTTQMEVFRPIDDGVGGGGGVDNGSSGGCTGDRGLAPSFDDSSGGSSVSEHFFLGNNNKETLAWHIKDHVRFHFHAV